MSSQRRLITVLALSALLPSAAMAETVGLASWYGDKHDGRRTSSGEIFDQEGFTAASRSIPLGSRVRVTSQDTGQSVVVTVNDRMGGHASVIDLSKGAAREIGLLGRGRGTVSIAAESDAPLEVAEATEDEGRGRVAYRRATWSATYAPRRPIGRGGPSVLSRAVCNSSSAFSSAPSNTT